MRAGSIHRLDWEGGLGSSDCCKRSRSLGVGVTNVVLSLVSIAQVKTPSTHILLARLFIHLLHSLNGSWRSGLHSSQKYSRLQSACPHCSCGALTVRRLFIRPDTDTRSMLPNIALVTLDHHDIGIYAMSAGSSFGEQPTISLTHAARHILAFLLILLHSLIHPIYS